MHLDIAVGEAKVDEDGEREHVKDLASKVRDLNSRLADIRREQQFQREREAEFRLLSEKTNSRAVWWSLFQLVTLGVTCFWQLRHLRLFFESKKLCVAFLSDPEGVERRRISDELCHSPGGERRKAEPERVMHLLPCNFERKRLRFEPRQGRAAGERERERANWKLKNRRARAKAGGAADGGRDFTNPGSRGLSSPRSPISTSPFSHR